MADNEQEWRGRIDAEWKRIRALDDTIAGTLNNILVAGSVGLIVASVTFLKDVAGQHPAAGSLFFLRTAWLVLLATATASIASLLTSRQAGKLNREVLAARLKNDDEGEAESERKCKRWNRGTAVLQWIGLIWLAIGAGTLVQFAMMNLPAEATAMATEDKNKDTPPPERKDRDGSFEKGTKGDRAFDHDPTDPFLKRPIDTTPKAKPDSGK
jgi:hypothetical protein